MLTVTTESSKRAVEAADNIVHAYDLNMQMPEVPLAPVNDTFSTKPKIYSSPNGISPHLPTLNGKTRVHIEDPDFHPGPPLKRICTMTESEILQTCYQVDSTTTLNSSTFIATEVSVSSEAASSTDCRSQRPTSDKRSSLTISPSMMSPTHRRVLTRHFIRSLVTDTLRSGHPISEKRIETELGETIEVKTFGSTGEVQELTIHLKIEPDVPEAIITKEQHLHFSLQKVIDNAIKFTENGSVTITVQLGKNSQLEIWIVDTGCGIAEESKSSIFKPHFQEDPSTSRSRDGLGLGLFNAKARVRKTLGGDVTLERSATEGHMKGSEFLIRLPISTQEAGSTDSPLVGSPSPTSSSPPHCRPSPWFDPISPSNSGSYASISHSSTPPTPTKKLPRNRVAINRDLGKQYPLNILIAEDNAINRNVAVGSLNKLGYTKENITVAFDGIEAVKCYEESLSSPSEQHFDAVLMDIWMPNMDGYEATAKILELAQTNEERVTIIAVTADVTEDNVDKAKDAGMHGFLAKPYTLLDIEHLIMEHFPREYGR